MILYVHKQVVINFKSVIVSVLSYNVNFSPISSQSFGLRSQLWFFCLFRSEEAVYLKLVQLNTFWSLQQFSNPIQTAAGVWPDSLETTFPSYLFHCSRWNKQWCGWFLLPLLESVQTCCVGSGSSVAAAIQLATHIWRCMLRQMLFCSVVLVLAAMYRRSGIARGHFYTLLASKWASRE